MREAVANQATRLAGAKTFRRDAVAGLTVAVSSVPDGMAAGILAGVNPMYGLYAGMVGPIVGGLLASTRLMIITTTSATALIAGQALLSTDALAGLSGADRDSALFLMVILSGLFQIAFGMLHFGRLTRFVSYSVMTGFLAGIAVLLILSQLPVISGYTGEGANRVMQTFDMLTRLHDADIASLALAAMTAALILALSRTRLAKFSSLIAIVAASLLLYVVGLEEVLTVDDEVQTVEDIATIPHDVPVPVLPRIAGIINVVTGALSIAVIVLVQGAGVSQTVPNPDGERTRISRDFIAQGAANVAAGLFRGLPVGGSFGTTAVSVTTGAQRRTAAILAGVWMAVIVIGLPDLVSRVAMPALGALLILAGLRGIKRDDLNAIWYAGWPARLAAITTFGATLLLPIQVAVGIGVVLSALLVVNESSTGISLVQLVEREDGRLIEAKPPTTLPDNQVTILDVYGHLFYAGARTLEALLPSPRGAQNPVVILRLRGRTSMGATLVEVISNYSKQLRAVNGRLYLTGLSEGAYQRVSSSARIRLSGPVHAYEATPVLGDSTRAALHDAEAWLVTYENDT